MNHPLVLFDDNCNNCSRWAGFIEKRDPSSKVRLIGQSSEEGQEILESMPVRFQGVDSVFLISSLGDWHAKSSAVWRIFRLLRFPWPIATAIALVPWPIRDAAYDLFARFRN
ncbi:MAG: DCC1-like thiol-disulfide oxidoreductase family protein [Candidatus Thermoplasmatota archaeon]|nr:DCC1-like thiol-disulfide oxidoreductase family protein [Candidatus Thermoplasmatota archaeon]